MCIYISYKKSKNIQESSGNIPYRDIHIRLQFLPSVPVGGLEVDPAWSKQLESPISLD